MKRLLTASLFAAALLAWLGAQLLAREHRLQLPFNGMEAAQKNKWEDFGGLWNIQNGIIFNRSDELGAKLVAGSSSWSDYRLSANMRMLGHRGEVGVIARVNDTAAGINAYRGYYVGFRSMD